MIARGGSRKPVEILLVEDNPYDKRLTEETVLASQADYNVAVVGDGVEAMEYLRGEGRHAGAPRPAIIILDLKMPRMDGFELLSRVRNDRSLKLIPIVVLTTSGSKTDVLRAYDLGANCYITKPIDLHELVDVVKMAVEFWTKAVELPEG